MEGAYHKSPRRWCSLPAGPAPSLHPLPGGIRRQGGARVGKRNASGARDHRWFNTDVFRVTGARVYYNVDAITARDMEVVGRRRVQLSRVVGRPSPRREGHERRRPLPVTWGGRWIRDSISPAKVWRQALGSHKDPPPFPRDCPASTAPSPLKRLRNPDGPSRNQKPPGDGGSPLARAERNTLVSVLFNARCPKDPGGAAFDRHPRCPWTSRPIRHESARAFKPTSIIAYTSPPAWWPKAGDDAQSTPPKCASRGSSARRVVRPAQEHPVACPGPRCWRSRP